MGEGGKVQAWSGDKVLEELEMGAGVNIVKIHWKYT